MRYKIILLLLVALFSFQHMTHAQRGFVTTEELKIERRFIDGVQEFVLGHYDKAIEIFEKLWVKNKNKAPIAFQLSRAYEASKQYGKAIEFGQKALNLDPKNEFYAMQLAESYEGNQELNKAAETYLEFAKNAPDDRFFLEKAVNLHLKDGNYQKAITVLNQLETMVGVEEPISRQKFEIFSKTDQPEKAAEELRNLANAFPEKPVYLINLASYYLQLNDFNNAEKVYDLVLSKFPKNETALKFKNISKQSSNKANQYLVALLSEIQNKNISLDKKIHKLIPVLNDLVKNPDTETANEVQNICIELKNQYPNEAKSHAILADIYMLNNNYESAAETYKKTIELDGTVFDVWAQYMESLHLTQKYDELIKTAENALYRFPNQALIYFYAGLGYNKKENFKDANSILQEGTMMTGRNALLKRNMLIQRSFSLASSNEKAKAKKLLNSLLVDKNLDADALIALHSIYNLLGDRSSAEHMKSQALKLFSNHPSVMSFFKEK